MWIYETFLKKYTYIHTYMQVIFTARCYASVVYVIVLCLYVCMCVCEHLHVTR